MNMEQMVKEITGAMLKASNAGVTRTDIKKAVLEFLDSIKLDEPTETVKVENGERPGDFIVTMPASFVLNGLREVVCR